jgi:hypothetical protein
LLNSSIFSSGRFGRQSLIYLCAALLFSVGLMLPVEAVEVPSLYSAEVPLDEESDNPRNDAYRSALIAVLARVSGSELSTNEEAVDELFPVPSAYVTQFRPGEDDSLWVSFDDEAIKRVLRASGQTVWGSDRPLTLVWLAVDWGQGEREIIAADDPDRSIQEARSIDRNRLLRERVLEIADQRGLPILFPLLDTTDLQSVTFSDIWGGFDDRIVDASARYGAYSVLIGRVRPSSSQLNRWTYIFGDESRNWTGSPEAVVAAVADILAAEFGVGGNVPVERVLLNVSGVQTVNAYGSLQEILSAISLIEGFRITEVAGDMVSYEVDVRGGAERLRRALRFAGLLEQIDSGDFSDDFSDDEPVSALDFFFSS